MFPWVLSDYTSPVLQLDKESSFRNLDLPMGALTPARQEAAAERYSATEGVGEKPLYVEHIPNARMKADQQPLRYTLFVFHDCVRLYDSHVSVHRDLPRSSRRKL